MKLSEQIEILRSTVLSDDCINAFIAQLKSLEEDSKLLAALQACGVDNWEGYSEALRMVDDD